MKASSRCLLCTLLLAAVRWAQAIPAGFARKRPASGEWSDPGWPREFARNGELKPWGFQLATNKVISVPCGAGCHAADDSSSKQVRFFDLFNFSNRVIQKWNICKSFSKRN
jgi:hypothetical protein